MPPPPPSLLLLLLLLAARSATAAMSDRVTANASCTYTFEEGQYNTAVNNTISGPVYQQPGNITLLWRPFVGWDVTPEYSRQGLAQPGTTPHVTLPDITAQSQGQIPECGQFLQNDAYTVEMWLLYHRRTDDQSPTVFLALGLLGNTVLYFTSFMRTEGAIDVVWFTLSHDGGVGSFGVVINFPAAPGDDIFQFIIGITPGGAASMLVINATSSTGNTTFAATYFPTKAFSLLSPIYITTGSLFGGSAEEEPTLLLLAHYCGSLNDSQKHQNFLAGYPPSIPYTRVNVTTGPTQTAISLNFANFICKDVDSTNVTGQILTLPINGGVLNISTNGGPLAPLPAVPYFIPFGGAVSVYYTGPFNLTGPAADSFTFRCAEGGAFSLQGTMYMNLTFTNHAPGEIPAQNSYTATETSTVVTTLVFPTDVDPTQNLTAVITSLPSGGSQLFQFAGSACTATTISLLGSVTDIRHRVCVYALPSAAYPTGQPLPPDSGSGATYVGFANFSFLVTDTFGARSPNNATVSTICINHLQANSSATYGIENQLMQVAIGGFDLLPGSSQVFNAFLIDLPVVGVLFADGDPAQLATAYVVPGANFTYRLTAIAPGIIYFNFYIEEQDIRAWASAPTFVQINNINTPHQPNISFALPPSTGLVVYTFNPTGFDGAVLWPGAEFQPVNTLLHLTIELSNSICASLCVPYNATFLVAKHLTTNHIFNQQLQFDLGAGCGDATLEISAPFNMLNLMLNHLTIRGNSFIDCTMRMAACLFTPEFLGIQTCDLTNPDISFYTIPLRLVQKDAPSTQSSSVIWTWFPPEFWVVIGFFVSMCCCCIVACIAGCFHNFVSCVDFLCCCTCGYVCNRCGFGDKPEDVDGLRENVTQLEEKVRQLESAKP